MSGPSIGISQTTFEVVTRINFDSFPDRDKIMMLHKLLLTFAPAAAEEKRAGYDKAAQTVLEQANQWWGK